MTIALDCKHNRMTSVNTVYKCGIPPPPTSYHNLFHPSGSTIKFFNVCTRSPQVGGMVFFSFMMLMCLHWVLEWYTKV